MTSLTLAEQRALAVVRRLPAGPVSGVEVGVGEGAMSAALLRRRPDLSLIMVDSWLPASEQPEAYRATGDSFAILPRWQQERNRHLAYAVTAFAEGRHAILEMDSLRAAAEMAGRPFTFVFLDAAHDLASVRADLAAWGPLVIPGGWLCGHDYVQGQNGVIAAVDAYAQAHGLRVELDENDTWFCRIPEAGA